MPHLQVFKSKEGLGGGGMGNKWEMREISRDGEKSAIAKEEEDRNKARE